MSGCRPMTDVLNTGFSAIDTFSAASVENPVLAPWKLLPAVGLPMIGAIECIFGGTRTAIACGGRLAFLQIPIVVDFCDCLLDHATAAQAGEGKLPQEQSCGRGCNVSEPGVMDVREILPVSVLHMRYETAIRPGTVSVRAGKCRDVLVELLCNRRFFVPLRAVPVQDCRRGASCFGVRVALGQFAKQAENAGVRG